MKTVSTNKCFGGTQGVYTHTSAACACDMTFGLFLPEEAADGPVPVLWYLSGLTCTHENAMAKAGAQSWAAEQGIALVFPDTSPRGDAVADDDAYDLGKGAGFYVNASQTPWAPHYQMHGYIADELPSLIAAEFSSRHGPASHHRPFDGRTRRLDAGHGPAGAVPLGLSFCADLPSDSQRLGRKNS